MSLTEKQLKSCILLGYQLLTYFDNPKNLHQELRTTELTDDILFITDTYDTPHLPKENLYPTDWLLQKELGRAIREFQKLVLKIPARQHQDKPRQTQHLGEPSGSHRPQPPKERPQTQRSKEPTESYQAQLHPQASPIIPTPGTFPLTDPLEGLSNLSSEVPLGDSEHTLPQLTTPLAPMQGKQQDVPQEPSSNITLSRAELHKILDDALTRALDEVITARRDDIRGPPGRDGQDAPHSTAHWKTDDVGYFTPDPTSDVHLKALIPLKSEEVVRANLPSCLREAAARWYSAELSDEERQDLSVRSLELGWFATLERRFKPRATEAIVKVMAPSSVYSWRDVRAGRSVTEWAQNMLRDAQAAEITGTTTVLRLVWTRLEPALQRDIREPSPATTISQFMADLDLRYGQWYEMSQRARPMQRQTQPQSVTPTVVDTTKPATLPSTGHTTDNRQLMWNSIPNVQRQSQQQFPRNAYQPPSNVPQIQAQRTSYVPPQQQQPQGAYQPRQQQQQQPPQGQTNLAGQLLLSDKPWNQAGYSNTGYVARQPRARPAAAYQAEPQEVAPPDESLPAFYDGQHFYDPTMTPYWQAPPFQDNEDDHDQPCYSVTEDLTPTATCLHCSAAFLSNNKLHAHLKDCASRHTAAAVDDTTVAYYISQQEGTETDALPPDLPIIRSDRARATQPGKAYKSWRYASTVVGLIDQHKLLVACLDTGCVMTIIDADLAKSLGIPLQKCIPVPVAGIGSRHLSSAYVSFDAFFRGADNAA
ncbi:hypothetical protein PDIDSM_3925 [Penicillium digitatum]|nr:hypothetical protein PDIDSM_3925 [Penicillium digitatum]